MSYRTPEPDGGHPVPGRGRPRHARPTRMRLTLAGVLFAISAVSAALGLVTVATDQTPASLHGSAQPAPPTTTRPPTTTTTHAPTTTTPATTTTPSLVAPLVPQGDNWTTLINPASGLSYQIPPTGWSTAPQVGRLGPVTLAQGAERTAYTCGTPPERLLRGVLGSGAAPRTDPAGVAEAVARAAAAQYYATGSAQPTVRVDAAQPVRRRTRSGTVLSGVLVRAVATQRADPCLASQGEILVFVLQFPDHDGVLLVNADVAGGPASPAPATDRELRTIVGTAGPTT